MRISPPQTPQRIARASHSARGQTWAAWPASASWQSLQAWYAPQHFILIATTSRGECQWMQRVSASEAAPRTSGLLIRARGEKVGERGDDQMREQQRRQAY